MAVRIQFRRGTGTEWYNSNPTLALGEMGYVTENYPTSGTVVYPKGGIKFGDGTTAWRDLSFAAAGDIFEVNAGNGLTGGATSGAATLAIDINKVFSTYSVSAKGDLLIGSGASAFTSKTVGSDYSVLTANSASAGGVAWDSTLTRVALKSPLETWNIVNEAPSSTTGGVRNLDVITSSAWYTTVDATNSWTLNVRGNGSTTLNSLLQTGQSITVSFAATIGATGYVQSSLTIDGGSAQTIQWQNALAPSANTSAIDVYTYTIVKTASATYTVFGSRTKFDSV
jgi:hypothetical protein